MEQYIAYNLALGIVRTSSKRKQELGRTFARILGFHPGPLGKDGGIDGVIREDGRLFYFQSKLSQSELTVDHAKILYADMMYHRAEISVMLSGVGYKKTFKDRLFGHPYLKPESIHLLSLVDILSKTDSYQLAIQDIPKLKLVEEINWKQFK
ncbi:restriction endonuclease [Sphaerospermopsis sp. LEGE 00249]|uniref:restriction endonuclease n=1 Tax=Sphaerospermopsis sp. LEGE 00249 TaxID=1380707 RepID=UPI00164E5209|nr:restriction endonuclease [Sphaerospermopsis sp. LEGE 00249]MBC5794169.1 restriction endonuclease [Sphaerospermopsis sp. LEGE 00249]